MKPLLAIVAFSLAGAAQADPLADAVMRKPAPAVKLQPRDAEAYALKRAGLARTAVEWREDKVAAAVGFLCGLKESADRSGGGTALGSDPHGRFVGAKFSLSFR